ncbi:MAG: hypothetical protein HC869_11120 [Rhodospirillales bacterium]|nr:hypothetical protein [Rhodospirillales bacterium]
MSFARQVSICRTECNLAITPTAQEWQLARLRRPGMSGDHCIQQALNPGQYIFGPGNGPSWQQIHRWQPDVADKRAAEIRRPKLVRLEHVLWQQSDHLDWTVYLPSEAPIIYVPIENADDAGLGYYNCRLIRARDVITLRHRSVIINFRYEEDYFERYVVGVLGGCSIEHHAFAHVDMPLDETSGYLLLGRIDPADQALELTAFVVRPMQRVYIPAQTIHTNDYLLGTWETLLSADCLFPSAQLRPSDEAVSAPVREHALPLLAFRA